MASFRAPADRNAMVRAGAIRVQSEQVVGFDRLHRSARANGFVSLRDYHAELASVGAGAGVATLESDQTRSEPHRRQPIGFLRSRDALVCCSSKDPKGP